jgi:hypothetical protein
MSYDPAWDMPQLHWQQQGSFEGGSIPPVVEPDAGTQVWLGPVAREWLPWICGSLDQLRNPSSWIVADDTAMYNTLRRVDTLMGLVCGNGGSEMPIMVRLQNCVLQTSSDGGVTWVDVPGWSANIAACTAQWLASQPPANPNNKLTNQRACDIAGFLSTAIIQGLVQHEVTAINTPLDEYSGWQKLLQDIPGFNAVTNTGLGAWGDLYSFIFAGTIAHWNSAQSDASLWSAVTCAIYNAIKNDGYVTPSNWLAVYTNISNIVYAHPDVITGLNLWVAGLGSTGLMALQQTGALDTVDCTGCGTWCHYDDFSTGLHGWALDIGTQVAGVGINQVLSGGVWWAQVHNYSLPIDCVPTDIVVYYTSDSNGAAQYRKVNVYEAGVYTYFFELNEGTWPAGTSSGNHGLAATISGMDIVHRSGYSGVAGAINGIKMRGNGPNPFGVDNCNYP